MKRLVILALTTLLPAGAALANPIAVDVLRIRQVPGTRHVQITFGHDGSVGGETPVPGILTRDDAKVDTVWVALDGSFTANTGSGLTGVQAQQTCDCEVPLGAHTYGVALDGPTTTLQGALTVVDPDAQAEADAGPTDDADAGAEEDADVYPWEIPEPTAIQGLDCAVNCAGAVAEPVVEDEPDVVDANAGPAADTGELDTAAVTGSTDTGTNVAGGGGCAAGGGSGAALLLAFGALLAFVLRRRVRA